MNQPVYYISQPMLYKNNRNWYGFKKMGGKVVSKKSLRTTSKKEALVWLKRMKAYQRSVTAAEEAGEGDIPLSAVGWLAPDTETLSLDDAENWETVKKLGKPLYIVQKENDFTLVAGNGRSLSFAPPSEEALPVTGCIPALTPENLGDSSFCEDHGITYPYYTGSMANGIASVEMVEAASRAGFLGFFGAAGLTPAAVEEAILTLKELCGDKPFGMNLIHSPAEPGLEDEIVSLYIKHGISLIEAAAFMTLTLPLVRFRTTGIHRDENGDVITPNRIIAKVSREEVASMFLSPPPAEFVEKLVSDGTLTREQAEMCSEIPMAQDITAEADSGGHTDNRPSFTIFPTMQALADAMQEEYDYTQQPRIGLGGGISTPSSAAAAFAMGAAYIVTGTVNQACVESGSSDIVREMLAEARQADIAMAPSADMFEMGVNVQVLKRGTMFSMRAAKLYELYRSYGSIEEIPADTRTKLEKTVFLDSLHSIWENTKAFWQQRNPSEIARAEKDPKHKMSLIFRSYLGQASNWANEGIPERKLDYQIWCGPAMGAFNEWVKGSFLEETAQRRVVTVGMNILYGAALLSRCNNLAGQGISVPAQILRFKPMPTEQLLEYIH